MTKREKLYKKMQNDPRFNSCYGEHELIYTRYGANGRGSKTECFFEERKGELYALKRARSECRTTQKLFRVSKQPFACR